MRPPIAAAVLALCAVAGAPAARAAEPYRTVSVANAFPHLELFQRKIPPEDRGLFTLAYYWTLNGAAAASLPAWLDYRVRRDPLPVGPDGRVEHLPTPPEMAARPWIGLAAPAQARFAVRLELLSTVRPAAEIDAGAVDRSIAAAAATIRRAAGPVGRLVPRIKKAVFVGATHGEAVFADGRAQPLPLDDGDPVYDPSKVNNADRLRFARAPSRVRLED